MPRRKGTSTNNILVYLAMKETEGHQLSETELAVLYYVANLMLVKWCSVVIQLCEQSLLRMNKATSMFRANIRRYLALIMFKSKCKELVSADTKKRIFALLNEAYTEF